ncbi:MAG TPA: CIA30 family protein [Chroococcidiopsis sp.]
MSSNTPFWDFSRFLKTLSYFDALPGLGCLWRWLGWPPALDPSLNPPLDPSTSPDSTGDRPQEHTLFDFTTLSPVALSATWGALDDVVMGGVSASTLQPTADGALFTGNVSIANSGGFASVRTRNFTQPLDLSADSGIHLQIKGDGNRYKFLMRSDVGWDSLAHAYSFDTPTDQWCDVYIPFASLVPVFRAKTVANAPPFNAAQVYSMQLMLSKFEYDGALNPHFTPGRFALCIAKIQGYSA